MKIIVGLLSLFLPIILLGQQSIPLFVGSYTEAGKNQGLYSYQFDLQTGKASLLEAVDAKNPSFITRNAAGTRLYTVNEVGSGKGAVSAYAIENGKLRFLNSLLTKGDNPCHIALHPDGKWLSVANYSGGSLTTFALDKKGSLKEIANFIQYKGSGPDISRQEAPHVHSSFFNKKGNELYVQDLGRDLIAIYQTDKKGALSNIPVEIATSPGGGPRHIALAKNNRFLYVLLEMTGRILTYEKSADKWVFQQDIGINAADYQGKNGAAELKLSPDGKFLYATNRDKANSIAIYKVQNDGLLDLVEVLPVGGKGPRNFNITPDGKWLLIANQYSHNIAVFKRDIATGLITKTDADIAVHAPVCIIF